MSEEPDEDDEESDEDDEDSDDDEDDEEEEIEEDEPFTCRVCHETTNVDDGDDLILLCDKCSTKYDIDRIWNDFDKDVILEEHLRTFDLAPYLLHSKKK